MITEEGFAQLKEDDICLMVLKSKAVNKKKMKRNQFQENLQDADSTTANANQKRSIKSSKLLRGLSAKTKASTNEVACNNDEILDNSRVQLNRLIKDSRDRS